MIESVTALITRGYFNGAMKASIRVVRNKTGMTILVAIVDLAVAPI